MPSLKTEKSSGSSELINKIGKDKIINLAMDQITIKSVQRKKDLITFIKVPWKIYQKDSAWVPPLIMDRKKLLNQKKNPFFQHAELELFVAFRGGEAVGRIAAITNENHNTFHEDNIGFFGFFESINDQAVASALLDHALNWIKDQGKDGVLGPMNPSTNDEIGLLIDGFDTPPMVMMCHNPPYYATLMENYGLKKAKDLYAWFYDARVSPFPERINRIAKLTGERYGITIRHIKLKTIMNELQLIRDVYNDAWSKNWGFVPMTEDEITHIANDLKQIAFEDLLLLAEMDGRPVGFSVSLPDINQILKKIPNGRLLPTGIFKLLFGMKKIDAIRVLILGIVKELQHGGLGSMLYLETFRRATARGIYKGEFSWILEDNNTMNGALETIGAKIYKTYRIYGQSF
jgi:GNAT superfamily N-acetyltransferase